VCLFFRINMLFFLSRKKSYLAEGGNIVKQNDTRCTMDDTLWQPNHYFMCVCVCARACVYSYIHAHMHIYIHIGIYIYTHTERSS